MQGQFFEQMEAHDAGLFTQRLPVRKQSGRDFFRMASKDLVTKDDRDGGRPQLRYPTFGGN